MDKKQLEIQKQIIKEEYITDKEVNERVASMLEEMKTGKRASNR